MKTEWMGSSNIYKNDQERSFLDKQIIVKTYFDIFAILVFLLKTKNAMG